VYTKSFEDIFFPSGTRIEFPYDLLLPNQKRNFVSFYLTNYGRAPDKIITDGIDYISVPTFDLGGSGKTKEESEKIVVDKIRECSVQVLLAAANYSPVIEADTEANLLKKTEQWMRRQTQLPHLFKCQLHPFKYNNKLIIVNTKADSCIICVRADIATFDDPTTGGFYSWTEMGFVVLNSNAVVFGVIK
jgi:hypothetical protein